VCLCVWREIEGESASSHLPSSPLRPWSRSRPSFSPASAGATGEGGGEGGELAEGRRLHMSRCVERDYICKERDYRCLERDSV
jgi:hypothetical protein